MSQNILFLPGFLGSHLGYSPGPLFAPRRLWLDPAAAITGQLARLELAADGQTPGPMAGNVVSGPLGLLTECYGPLLAFMRLLGWNVSAFPYDWRLSVQATGPLAAASAVAAFGDDPFSFVAHSQGSLVAWSAVLTLVGQGRGAQVQRLVTLGAPFWGGWEPVRVFSGLPFIMRGLEILTGWQGLVPGGLSPAWLEACVASWPGLYEMLPWRDAGPLFSADPATAASLYQAGTYLGGNAFVRQTRLDAAAGTQHFLAHDPLMGKVVSIQGTGYATPVDVQSTYPLTDNRGYVYSLKGDGQVAQAYATIPDASVVLVDSLHMFLPLAPEVWAALPFAVSGAVPAVGIVHRGARAIAAFPGSV